MLGVLLGGFVVVGSVALVLFPGLNSDIASVPDLDRSTPRIRQFPEGAAVRSQMEGLAKSFNDGNRPANGDLIDADSLAVRMTWGVPMPAWERSKLSRALQNTLAKRLLRDFFRNDGEISLLHVYQRNGRTFALFRVIVESGLNYWECELTKSANGRYRFVDLYNFALGEWTSQLGRRLVLAGLQKQGRLWSLESVSEEDRLLVKHMSEVQRFREALTNGHYHLALQTDKTLPPPLRRSKIISLMRLRALSSLEDPEAYRVELNSYIQRFPNDPGIDLVALDAELLTEQWDRAMEAVNRLDRSVDSDPFLDVLRGRIHYQLGDLPKAEECNKRALQRESDLLDAHLELLYITLDNGDQAQSASHLKILKEAQWPQEDLQEAELRLSSDPTDS